MSTYPAPPPNPQGPALPSTTERTVSIVAHLSAIIASVVSAGWLTFLGPLIVWLVYKDRSVIARQASAGAFNFNLAIWVGIIVGWICLFTVILIPVAFVIWAVAFVLELWCSIKGAIKASNGEVYRYPFSIPVLS